MSFKLARTIFSQILETVEFTHSKGYCHRDIKLENVFLTDDYKLKLGDFGCASLLDEELITCKGTEMYMPPEVF
jgi:serine/threonine protein kinase